jgi:thiol-disulfide isomerase/thioredoxin
LNFTIVLKEFCFNLDRDRCEKLSEKFDVDCIPFLTVLSPSLEIVVSDGVNEIRAAPAEALRKWCQGKRLFWSREPAKDEYVWEDADCNECFLSPLLGSRYGCTNDECKIDLCETCFQKTKHEHPLLKFLFPNQQYSLEKLFESMPYLLDPKKEEQIQTTTILQTTLKFIGFYFSAHWCSPCCQFTPQLAKLYKETDTTSQSFHIIFISSDEDEDSFNKYRSEMPWLAAAFNSGGHLHEYFKTSGMIYFY